MNNESRTKKKTRAVWREILLSKEQRLTLDESICLIDDLDEAENRIATLERELAKLHTN
jgi:hypothetical protein